MIVILILIGITSGVLIGMIGTGAGILMIPGMIYMGGLSFKEAVAITLLMQTIPVGIVGAYQYWNKGLLKITPAIMTAIGMFIGITLGGMISTEGYIRENTLRYIFGIVAIITGLYILLN